jgi:hypothetical protein
MANFVFNIAKGRVVEFYNRVENNDPAASRLLVIPLAVGDTEANRQDDDNISVFLAAAPNEAAASWGRKVLTDVELAALPAPDDTNNRYAVAVPLVTWTTPTVGQDTVAVVVAYDSTAGGADTALIPLTYHDFVITANGADVSINAGDFFRAS